MLQYYFCYTLIIAKCYEVWENTQHVAQGNFAEITKFLKLLCFSQGSLKGESVVAAILPSRMEQSYCTSGFFRFQARFLTSSAPILTITHYLRTVFHQTRNLTHLPKQRLKLFRPKIRPTEISIWNSCKISDIECL